MRLECTNILDGEPCRCQTFKIQVPPEGTPKGLRYTHLICEKCNALYLLKCLGHDSIGTISGETTEVINYITGVQLERYKTSIV